MGNRTYKEFIRRTIGNYSQDTADYTYYVRDAQGNTMATYTRHVEPGSTLPLKWSEQHLYGSSRLGVINLNLGIPAQTTVPPVNQTLADSLHTGQVVYELTNHLGNVMAVISDKKLFSNIVIPQTGAAPLYYPEVLSQTDYYAFGQEIKERAYRISGEYRYGFNGKESDPEVSGNGNQYDYGFRIYNPRIGRFLSNDPLFKSYPELTPYQFASNSPIEAIDLDGLEAESSKKEGFLKSFGKSALRGVGNVISYVANNPNHAGYDINPKKLKVEDFEPYKINWSQQLDPTWQIENFSNNLVFGSVNFVGGIFNGDGARTAQAIPPLLGSAGTVVGLKGFTYPKSMTLVPKYMSGTFVIGPKTLTKITKHLEQFGVHAENEIMLSRMRKIVNKEIKATEIDLNFAKHELRELELMKGGKMTYEEAHSKVLKEQGMDGLNVSEYEKKLYTEEALKAGNAEMQKQIKKK